MTGVSAVTLVPAPAAGVRRLIRWGAIHNRDSAAVTLTVVVRQLANDYYICALTLQPGDTLLFDDSDLPVLDATNKSLVGFLAAGVATFQPTANFTYGDAS